MRVSPGERGSADVANSRAQLDEGRPPARPAPVGQRSDGDPKNCRRLCRGERQVRVRGRDSTPTAISRFNLQLHAKFLYDHRLWLRSLAYFAPSRKRNKIGTSVMAFLPTSARARGRSSRRLMLLAQSLHSQLKNEQREQANQLHNCALCRGCGVRSDTSRNR